MSKLFNSKQVAGPITTMKWLRLLPIMVTLLCTLKESNVEAQCLTVTKNLLGVAAPSSGIQGHFNATFEIIIVDTCVTIPKRALSIDVFDYAAVNFGSAFVGVVGLPIIAYVSFPNTGGNINPAYNGGILGNANFTDGTGTLEPGDSSIYHITYELNPNAVGAPLPLQNIAFTFHAVQFEPPPLEYTTFSNAVIIPDCWTGCQMTCNNSVQVSVNSMCKAEIVSEMILEGEVAECAEFGFYEVSLSYKGIPVSLPVDSTFIGKLLTVSVKNVACGNRCWGTLLIEDKTPPVLNCRIRDTLSCGTNLNPINTGFPVNISQVDLTKYPYIVTGIDACGSVTLTFTDRLVKYDCSNALLSATLYREWCAVDATGFRVCCTDTIDLQRGTIADITLPPHYDGIAGADILLCDSTFKSNPNKKWTRLPISGFPDTSATGTGAPTGIYCGNIQFDFTDDTLQVCPGSYKLLRKWLIIDWCNPGNKVTYIQQIKVVDEKPPVINCPLNAITIVNANPWNCEASYILPEPTRDQAFIGKLPVIIDECSGWTYSVTHKAAPIPNPDPINCTVGPPGLGDTRNIVQLPDGRYRLDHLALGCHWVHYIIMDSCGNISTPCPIEIKVVDVTPPVAVCHQKTVISVGSNGRALVPASVFSDKSHDNCGTVRFQVARMNSGQCGSTQFRDSIEFCCADVSATVPVRVRLRVFDEAGNSSECMVEAYIQDKIAPTITCPQDVTVNCTRDISNLNQFGRATATDNCNAIISDTSRYELNICGIGKIYREFTATDPGKLTDICVQVITVVDSTPFIGANINWPADAVIIGCLNLNTSVEALGKPTYNNADRCNQLASNHEDLVFTFVENACIKILRKWTVIDWCRYDPTKTGDSSGIWVRTQVIKVNNTEAPTITCAYPNSEFPITSGCSTSITLEASATDDCTAPVDIRWSYQLFNNNGNVQLTSGNRNRVTRTFTQGSYRIVWTAEDLCGNKSSCTFSFTVADRKLPTPICLNGIITVLMELSGNVTIWAKDFNLNSEDNCTEKQKLRYSFTSNIKDSFKIYTCSDIANGIADTVDVTIYVFDSIGNKDFCKTSIVLQDNNNVCPDVTTLTNANIAGIVRLVNNEVASKVPVYINPNSGSALDQPTDQSGHYAFMDLATHSGYMIKPELNTDPIEGISTKDIIKIQRHILGIENFTSPFQLIAADVNKSKTVTAKDMADLRKLILGVHSQFQNSKSWDFLDASFPIDMTNAFDCPDFVNISNLNTDMMQNDFIAVKIGDVTGEAKTDTRKINVRENQTLNFFIPATPVNGEGIQRMPVITNTALQQLQGFQFSVTSQNLQNEIIGIESGELDITNENYRILGGNVLNISWNNHAGQSIEANKTLFYILVKSFSGNSANELSINPSGMQSELYTKSKDYNLDILMESRANGDAKYSLYQNIPNPFVQKTTIYYSLPIDEQVQLSVYDLSGKIVQFVVENGKKGLNSIELNMESIPAEGVLFYRLEANGFSAIRKMVILK